MEIEQVKSCVKGSLPDSIATLKEYLKFPTVSAQNKAIPETVE
jgi:hypothetical protein